MEAGNRDLFANYGLASLYRNHQFPYAGLQKGLAKEDSGITAGSFVLDDSGATAISYKYCFFCCKSSFRCHGCQF